MRMGLGAGGGEGGRVDGERVCLHACVDGYGAGVGRFEETIPHPILLPTCHTHAQPPPIFHLPPLPLPLIMNVILPLPLSTVYHFLTCSVCNPSPHTHTRHAADHLFDPPPPPLALV